MSIRSNIEKVSNRIDEDPAFGSEVQVKAKDAIKHGESSPEWKAYMELFAANDRELARLLPADGTAGDPQLDVARTYLLANGMCGAETTGGTELLFGIDDMLDDGL